MRAVFIVGQAGSLRRVGNPPLGCGSAALRLATHPPQPQPNSSPCYNRFFMPTPTVSGAVQPRLRRTLGLWDLVFCGIILVQPTAPMPVFGIVGQEAKGHVVTAIVIAMFAMMFTAVSYGRMARAYPSAGSAFTYVGCEINPNLGFLTGWGMMLNYMLNTLVCTIWSSKAAGNIYPAIPYGGWVILFALLFTALNLRGIRASARTNE